MMMVFVRPSIAVKNGQDSWTRGEKAVTWCAVGRISRFAEDFCFIGVLPQAVTFWHVVACSDIVHDYYKSSLRSVL
jgi:hypothetical protein